MKEDDLARVVVDCAYRVHKALGPGLLESTYETILAYELTKRGVPVRRQVAMPIRWEHLFVSDAYRVDLLVGDILIVELKAVESVPAVCARQVITYLRASNLRLGLLINFGAHRIKDGIVRLANGMPI